MIRPRTNPLRAAKLAKWLPATCLLASATSVLAQIPADQIAPSAIKQMGQILKTKHSLHPAEQKISSNLALACRQVRFEPTSGTDAIINHSNVTGDGMVTVRIKAPSDPSVINRITSNGGTVLKTFPDQNTIMARVPLAAVPSVAAGPKIQQVSEPGFCHANVGAVTSQGYVAHKAKNVVEGLGVNGTGVSVGVLSVSATAPRVAALIASGDLPADTVVLPGQDTSGDPTVDDDEGTAMMEIIHDLAPGAKLFFATGFTGEDQFATNIANLAAAGCKVIVDDISYFDEGVFQDSTIALAVDKFVAGGGIYFSSAANSGNVDSGTGGTWEGDFVSGGGVPLPINDGTSAVVHNFNVKGTPALYDTLTGATNFIGLSWSDPLGNSTNDYDLFILDSTGKTVLGAGTTRQTGAGSDPFDYAVPADGVASFPAGSRVVIVQYNDGATQSFTRALHVDTERGALSIATQGTTFGHNAGASTQSMAATYWGSGKRGVTAFTGAANPVETFSSDGPRKIFYTPTGTPIGTGTPTFTNTAAGQTLLKPDFTAADGVTTKTPGFTPFFGTSAAAPHAAAIAALVMSANPSLTNTQVHNVLVQTALNNGAPGFDRDGGYGVLDALAAVNAARTQAVPAHQN